MNTPKQPAEPDPVATANAQGQMNRDTATAQAQLNMVDQNGPGGSSRFNQIGTYADGTPKFEQNVSLSPTGQALYDSQNRIQQSALDLGQGAIGRVQNAINQPFNTSNLPGQVYGVSAGKLPNSGDYAANVKSVQDALMSRLAPQIEQDRTRLETQLSNQGITKGTDAYNRATTLNEQNVNDQRTQALLAASQEQSRLAGLDMASQGQQFDQGVTNANLNNSGRQTGIQEAAYLRSQPINELAALMGFSPGVQIPQFQNTTATGIAPPDYQGAVQNGYNAQLNNYNAAQGRNSALLGSIFGLGGSLGGAAILSDRRAKTGIRRIGRADNGLQIYSYRYKDGGPVQIGFMADEVEKVKPWAVVERPDGFKAVNYSLAVA